MDLAAKIIADASRAAEDRLMKDRAARDESMSCNGVMSHSKRRNPLIETAHLPTPREVIRQVIRDEEYVDATSKARRKQPGIFSRLHSRWDRWWYGAKKHHTHRIITRCELRLYDEIPNSMEDLWEEDEKGNPIPEDQLPFKKVTVEKDTAAKLIKVLFLGALVLELDDGTYLIAGWEHVAKL